jgi:serine/threonine protein kinase
MASSPSTASTTDAIRAQTLFAPAPAGVAVAGEAGRAKTPRNDALPPGTRLGEFEIVRVLGAGGFGIVYLALDHSLLRQVAIKEYMPSEFARRSGDSQVSVCAPSHAATFATGLRSFIKEAQLLASFDHPSLLKVHRFWEDNGTAYMAMQYYPGQTLKQASLAMAGPPDEAWLRRVLDHLLGALEVLHAQGVYHRDIAPDNILLLPDGCPVLLDFGSARRVFADGVQALTAVFKPYFSPIEQYADVPDMRQGPWTDLYALGAVVHFMLTGRRPVPAAVRVVHDHMAALSVAGAPITGMSAPFLRAIDWALAVRPAKRPQSVQAFRDALEGIVTPPLPTARRRAPPNPEPPQVALSMPAPIDPAVRHTQPTGSFATTATQARPTRDASTHDTAVRDPARRVARNAFALLAMALVGVAALGAWTPWASPTADAAAATVAANATVPAAAATVPAAAAVPAPAKVAAATAAPRRMPADAPVLRRRPVVATAAPTVASPRDACGDRNFLSMAICMNRQCGEPTLRPHAECVKWLRYDQARQQGESNR